MTKTNQTQSAGDNSTQIQAGTIQNYYTTITGIDEARARSICKEEYAIAMQNWTSEAIAIANDRVQQLEDKVLPKLIQYDNSLKCFADPSFQITLRKAQISAASSDRVADYELLSELLLHRVEQDADKERRLGITKAIEIVDQVDDSALVGLSVVYALSKFSPVSVVLNEGLNVLNRLYAKIISDMSLPEGITWMEHLDLVSAIRLGSRGLNTFKKCEEYFPERLSQYFVSGLPKDSDEYRDLEASFKSVSLGTNCLVPHPLRLDHMILSIKPDIDSIVITRDVSGGVLQVPLNPAQKEVMSKAIDLMARIDLNNQEMKSAFWVEWEKYPVLSRIRKWWNNLPVHFEISPVGVALSNAYIHSKDPYIPCLY